MGYEASQLDDYCCAARGRGSAQSCFKAPHPTGRGRVGHMRISGTATSAAIKSQAEQVVRAVRGVNEVDNQITISGI